MRPHGPLRHLTGLALTAIVAAIAWLAVGRGLLDRVGESNERSGGGGPQARRIVDPRNLGPVVDRFRRAVGGDARLVTVVLRPLSVEFVAVRAGRAAGYRWREGEEALETFEVGGSGRAGGAESPPYPLRRLDAAAPGRVARAISAAEGGDFHLSIGDLTRAGSGKLVWVLRGTIGERGVAYSADPHGRGAKPYNPAGPELSAGARLGDCIRRARGDPARLQRCVRRYAPR